MMRRLEAGLSGASDFFGTFETSAMSALWSLLEGKQTFPNVDYKRPWIMTQSISGYPSAFALA